MENPKEISEEEWKERLSPQEFKILRKKGTERPGTGKFLGNKEDGIYTCKGCGTELFSSEAKYESGSGWPSFFKPAKNENIETERDTSAGMIRTEIKCKNCGGHLGHLFNDGPKPTGKRYCVNSASLDFAKKE